MTKRALVLYTSHSGNTAKVAQAIGHGIRRAGLTTQVLQLDEDTDLALNLDDYALVCVGSPVIWRLPTRQIVLFLRNKPRPHRRVNPGPQKAAVFCTYAGIHLGPRESEAALKLLEIEIAHLGFDVIGSLAVPGRYGDNSMTDQWYHGDMTGRPNAADLERAEAFGQRLAQQVLGEA